MEETELVIGSMEHLGCAQRRAKSESDGSASYRLGNQGMKTGKVVEVQLARSLSADLKKLHFVLQTVRATQGFGAIIKLMCFHLSFLEGTFYLKRHNNFSTSVHQSKQTFC